MKTGFWETTTLYSELAENATFQAHCSVRLRYDYGGGSEMNHAEGIIGLIMGLGSILLGLTGREFYALGPGQRPRPKTRRIPRWFGVLWFGAFGCLLIYWSVPALTGRWVRRDLYGGVWIIAFLGVAWLLNKALGRLASGLYRENPIQTLSLKRDR